MNGSKSVGFALDMGCSFKKIINLDVGSLERLAICGGLNTDRFDELLSWTGRQTGNVRINFRGESFVTRAVRNPVIRGCPICLREDIPDGADEPLKHLAMQGHWQLREVSVCLVHRHHLVPLWEQSVPTARYDYSERLREILPNLMNGDFDRPPISPSPYDHWLDTRLETGQDKTWLAQHSLYAATTFCRLLGTELLRLEAPSNLDDEAQRRMAQVKGFEVARHGEAAIRDALDALAAFANGASDEPKKAFGNLYVNLSRPYLHEPAFAPFRAILRDCILDVWPVAAGEDVLGVTLSSRKLHSVNSAEKETGIGAFILDQFLAAAGAFNADDLRPLSRKTFDAVRYADLLAEIPTLVGPIEMQKLMGATRNQFQSLIADCVLTPRIGISTVKSPWRASDGLTLVAELQERAFPVDPTDKHWESISRAKNRSSLSIGTIIGAILDGELRVGQHTGTNGFAGFCVLKAEMDEMPMKGC
jgi:hypothetical protein